MATEPRAGKRELSAQELALVDILIDRATQSGRAPDEVVEFMGDIIDAVTDAVADAADAVTDAVVEAGEAVADAVMDFVDAIGDREMVDEATTEALVRAVKAVATMKSPTLQQLLDLRAASQRAEKGRE